MGDRLRHKSQLSLVPWVLLISRESVVNEERGEGIYEMGKVERYGVNGCFKEGSWRDHGGSRCMSEGWVCSCVCV